MIYVFCQNHDFQWFLNISPVLPSPWFRLDFTMLHIGLLLVSVNTGMSILFYFQLKKLITEKNTKRNLAVPCLTNSILNNQKTAKHDKCYLSTIPQMFRVMTGKTKLYISITNKITRSFKDTINPLQLFAKNTNSSIKTIND